MAQVLEMMGNAIAATLTALWTLLSGLTLNPFYWDAYGWLVFLLLLALVLLLLLRGRRRVDAVPAMPEPDLLISLGEISVYEVEEVGNVAEAVICDVAMLVSNMGESSVQLLEIALTTDEMKTPLPIEAAYFIPGNSAVQVKERVLGLYGEEGVLSLYFYAAATAKKYYRLQAPFEWEPWNGRYKIAPMGQSISPSKKLASTGVKKLREKEWRERQAHVEAHKPPEETPQALERPSGDYRFPDEF